MGSREFPASGEINHQRGPSGEKIKIYGSFPPLYSEEEKLPVLGMI
jgi:hypothetical protein